MAGTGEAAIGPLISCARPIQRNTLNRRHPMKGLKGFLTTSTVAILIGAGALVVTTVGAAAHTVCNSNG